MMGALIGFFVVTLVFGVLGFAFKITFSVFKLLFSVLVTVGGIVLVVSFAVPILIVGLCVACILGVFFGGARLIRG